MTKQDLGTTIITQIGIVVNNIEIAAQRWADVFKLPMPDIIITDAVDLACTEYMGSSTPARAKLAFFDFGQVDVELIEPIDGPSTWKDQLDLHGESIHHIAFEIQGMRESITYLADKGIPLVQRGEYSGGRYAYLDGTGQLGTFLELLEND